MDKTCSIDMDMQHMDMDMQYGHAHVHAALLWSCSMYLDNGHAWMPECRNADKEFSPASLVFR